MFDSGVDKFFEVKKSGELFLLTLSRDFDELFSSSRGWQLNAPAAVYATAHNSSAPHG